MTEQQLRPRDPLPVADRWYSAQRITESLTVITEPHVHPFLQANVWHLRGRDRDLVVDTGLGVAPLRSEMPQLFERDPIVVLTHAHLDHSGGAHEFPECHVHPLESMIEPNPASLNGPTLGRQFALDPSSLPEPLPELLLSALPRRGFDPDSYRLRSCPRISPLADGDVIDLGNRRLTVVHLPGHSPGSIGLFDESCRTLFSGDVVYELSEGDQLLDEMRGTDIDAYVASLKRLASLKIETTYAGHGEPLDRSALSSVIDAYVARRSRA